MVLYFLLVSLLTVLPHVGAENGAQVPIKPKSVELAEAQIPWLRAKGGFYSPKISIDPLFESDSPQVPLGLFAKEGFAKGETVMVVPRSCLLTAGPDSDDMCITAMNLVQERRLGEQSEYAPYVTYMFSKESVSLPSSWSLLGKKLIRKIRGKHLPPEDLTDVSFENHCEEHLQDVDPAIRNDLEFAYLSVVSRAWSDKLVGVYDMLNHGFPGNVDSTSIHGSEDITAHATRDIAAGEQLYLSYIDCIDEVDYEFEYVTPQMLRDFGFVDDYPQRWIFPGGKQATDDEDLVFDLDFVEPKSATKDMKITWHTEEPTTKQMRFLKKELVRVDAIKPYVTQVADLLESDWERHVALTYYQSLNLALQYATGNITRTEGSCGTDTSGDVCLADPGTERKLETPPAESTANEPIPTPSIGEAADTDSHSTESTGSDPNEWMACDDHWRIKDDFELLEEFHSHYQEIEVFHDPKDDDVCLYLNGYLHTCASSRPHYHEVFVHYAARFMDQVKRVIFIGGGDSKVLHEVLKYPSLELVVGLELDQLVVRSSFKGFGTQPHWDNDKVEWYFGDAAKSLSVLPSSYYGTFDLVIVDILTDVAEVLKVNDELTLLDAATLLMKPDGIIVKNEDQGYVPGSRSVNHTNYSVDLVFHDVPNYCLQVFVASSKTVDFLAVTPTDHKVQTFYLRGMENFQSQFDSWYNFGVTSSQTSSNCNTNEEVKPNEMASSVGVLMILEAENIAVPLDSAAAIAADISQAIEKVGLSEIDSLTFPLSVQGMEGYSIVVLTKEGYITARCISSLQYCAFDIHLYGEDIGKLATVKAELMGVVKCQQSSSYRFVTGGMHGRENQGDKVIGPPVASELCSSTTDTVEEPPPGQKVRKEKAPKDFYSPKAVGLHSYDNSESLKQWRSQRPIGVQAFAQFEVPPFWEGEEVLILYQGGWVEGTIVKVRKTTKYEVAYKDGFPSEKGVDGTRLQKSANGADKNVVQERLLLILNSIFLSAGQKVDVRNLEARELLAGSGDGLTFVFAWSGGMVVATWDGRGLVSFNFFLSIASVNLMEVFGDVFMGLGQDPSILNVLATLDDFPRGTGRVVNFEEEIDGVGETPVWG